MESEIYLDYTLNVQDRTNWPGPIVPGFVAIAKKTTDGNRLISINLMSKMGEADTMIVTAPQADEAGALAQARRVIDWLEGADVIPDRIHQAVESGLISQEVANWLLGREPNDAE